MGLPVNPYRYLLSNAPGNDFVRFLLTPITRSYPDIVIVPCQSHSAYATLLVEGLLSTRGFLSWGLLRWKR
jgi:hypothetical protein